MAMDFVDWEDVDTTTRRKSSGGGSGKFLRLEANKTHRVRPVHKAVMFYKIFNKVGNKLNSVCVAEDSVIPQKYPELKPGRKFAIVVFDRDDENKLKILEFGSTVFEALKYYKKMTKDEPGGTNGGDFTIFVDCPSGRKDRETTYKVDFVERKEFTDEEKGRYKESKEEFSLKTIYAPLDDETAEKILFSAGDGGQSQPAAQTEAKQTAQPVAKESVEASATSEKKDDFNW